MALAPALLLTEAAMLTAAVVGGWSRQKLRGWGWSWRNRDWVRGRRRQLQAERRVPDWVIAELMTGRVTPSGVPTTPGLGVFNAVAGGYWALARPLLRRR